MSDDPIRSAIALGVDETSEAAGRAGGFACVVGVDRAGRADAPREHGADIVVSDVAELVDAA